MRIHSSPHHAASSVLLIAGILLMATTLRAPITGIAPVLGDIRDTFSLGTAAAGALTTLPLLAFALASPVAVTAARWFGLERSLFGGLLLIAAGIVLRSLGQVMFLFLGTALIGVGIAIANVLIPSLLKRDFPQRIAALTSAYALTAGIAAALASALAIPIAALPGAGWPWALGSLVVLPLAAAVLWLPQLKRQVARAGGRPQTAHAPVWRYALAWQVTFFFGLNSLVYYVITTWMPAMLVESGYSTAAAGSLHGISQLATAIPGFFMGLLISRCQDQRLIAVGSVGLMAVSVLGLLCLPGLSTLWAVLFGCSAGANFILALAFISMRSANPQQAVALSGMAQLVGYLVAAAAPPLAGLIHDQTHHWAVPLVLCAVVCVFMAGFGYRAGRGLQIAAD